MCIFQQADNWMYDLELQSKYGIITNKERKIYQKLCIIKEKYYKRYKNSEKYRIATARGYCPKPIGGGNRYNPFYKSKFIKKLKGGE